MTEVKLSIDVSGEKRPYLGGMYVVEWVCPKCKSKQSMDAVPDYISYPAVGQQDVLYVYCKHDPKDQPMCEYIMEIPYEIKEISMILDLGEAKDSDENYD